MPVFLLIFVHNVVIWSFQLNLKFITTPRNLVLSTCSIGTLSMSSCRLFGGINFLFGLKIIKLVFLMFKESLFTLNHDTIFTISVLIILMMVSKSLCLKNKFVSSAKRLNLARLNVLTISLTYRMNRMGLKMEPWGTPQVIDKKMNPYNLYLHIVVY